MGSGLANSHLPLVSGTSLTNITYAAYYPTGQVKATWGSQTYPTVTLYDEQNRKTELRTFKDLPLASLSTENLNLATLVDFTATTWTYGPTTGLLTRKQYAGGKGTDYT